MSKSLFITGTATDIGKTYVSGLIVKKLNESANNPGYFKAAVSGNERDENEQLIPGDAMFVKKMSGISQPLNEMCPYVYENAYSPHLAARIEGGQVELETIKKYYKKVCNTYNYVTVEGSGGILCPIRFDETKIWLEDIVKMFNLNSVIVADAGLGTINAVVLTVKYMQLKGLPVKGIIYNNFHPGRCMDEDNIYMCEYMTGIRTLAKVKPGDKDIEIDETLLKSLYN